MQAYVGIPRWFPVSLQDDSGVAITGVTAAQVVIAYKLNDNDAVALSVSGTAPITWKEDDSTLMPGLYQFLYTPIEAGMLMYRVDTISPATAAVTYEGAIDVLLGTYYGAGGDASAAQNTLGGLRQMAMDRVDEQTNPDTGRFSIAWWNRQINYVYRFLAEHTGFYIKRTELNTVENESGIVLPTDIGWGIMRATYDQNPLEADDVFYLDSDNPGWELGSQSTPSTYMVNWPKLELYPPPERTTTYGVTLVDGKTNAAAFTNQPNNDAVEVVLADSGDAAKTVTIYGTTFRTRIVVSEVVTGGGTTVKTDWGYILGVECSAVPTGTITIREASGDATITTITGGGATRFAGILAGSDLASTEAFDCRPWMYSSGTSTALIGIVETETSATGVVTDSVVNNCRALPGIAVSSLSQSLYESENTVGVGEAITFTAFFTKVVAGQSVGATGLTVTVTIYDAAGTVIAALTGEAATAVGSGIYQYVLAAGYVTTPGHYRAIFSTTDAEVEVAEIPAEIYCIGGAVTNLLANTLSGIVRFPYPMTTVDKVLVGAFPAGQTLTIFTGAALEIMHGGIPPALVNDSSISFLPGGFTYLLADGAAVLALTGDLRYNESTNSQTAPLIQQFWQGVGQLEALMDTMQRDRVQQMEVISPHSPYA
jgi:hypothetical protein